MPKTPGACLCLRLLPLGDCWEEVCVSCLKPCLFARASVGLRTAVGQGLSYLKPVLCTGVSILSPPLFPPGTAGRRCAWW